MLTLDLLLVPEVGIEPTRSCPRGILSPVRLPISPLRQMFRDYSESLLSPSRKKTDNNFSDKVPYRVRENILTHHFVFAIKGLLEWGCSSVGRALDWQSRGQRFDPAQLHQTFKKGSAISPDPFFVSARQINIPEKFTLSFDVEPHDNQSTLPEHKAHTNLLFLSEISGRMTLFYAIRSA